MLRLASGRSIVAAFLALMVLFGMAGCGDAVAVQRLDMSTAVVVAHHRNELEPRLADSDEARLRRDASTPGAVAFVVAAGRDEVTEVNLTPRRPNGQEEHGPRRRSLIDARLAELKQAIARAAAAGTGTDLLAALGVAARTRARTILVLSSGVHTVNPFDQRVAGWEQDPVAFARDLAARGFLADMRGRIVIFSGFNRTAGDQLPLPLPQQSYVRAEWIEICRAAGAESCETNDDVRVASPPVSNYPAPVVPVPTVTTVAGPHGSTQVSVPSPLLFRPDSCDLIDASAAARTLAPIADQLRRGGVTVAISGRTAPVGPGDGIALSRCRAERARDLLLGQGVPSSAITSARGDGHRLDPPSASRDNQGRSDPAKLAALRRVVFTLTPVRSS